MLQRIAGMAVAAVTLAGGLAGQGVTVRGSLTVLDRDNRAARDVAEAVVWLVRQAPAAAARPDTAEIITDRREFRPRIAVVTPGDAVTFPNRDGFNHNVFSLSEEAPFDLGLYGRNQARAVTFPRPGIVRVYCNVHASMSAFVVVVPEALFARPDADGSFRIASVPPGRYTLHAWHERGAQVGQQDLVVTARAPEAIALTLDASGFRPQQHTNKYGQPYRAAGRRY